MKDFNSFKYSKFSNQNWI